MDDPAQEGPAKASVPERPSVDMGFPFRPIFLFFLVLVPCYLMIFLGVEHWRNRQGPWILTFTIEATGVPVLRVQHSLIVPSGVEIRFADEHPSGLTNGSVTLSRPLQVLPWGERISEDLMAFPGVETLNLFGHEVELAPRVLVVNRHEIPWGSQAVVIPKTSEKLPPLPAATPKTRKVY